NACRARLKPLQLAPAGRSCHSTVGREVEGSRRGDRTATRRELVHACEERLTAGGRPCDIGGCTLRHKECQWPKWALALVPMTSVRRSLCGLYAPTKGAFTWKS